MLSKTQKEALDKLRAAGGLENDVDWYELGLGKSTVMALIKAGYCKAGAKYVTKSQLFYRFVAPAVRLTAYASQAKVKPEAVTAVCQCCFRAVVVKDGLIVSHGWKEVGNRRQGSYGNVWHTGSCFGVGFKPFEVSCERTQWYVAELKKSLVDARDALQKAQDPSQRPARLSYPDYVPGQREPVVKWVEDDGGSVYMAALLGYVRWLESQERQLTRYVAELEGKLANWREPEPEA